MPDPVVYDTNVWISGILWRGAPYRCLLLARARLVQPVYCLEMLAELSAKLRNPFGFSEHELAAILYDYKRVSKRVSIGAPQRFVPGDPDDDKFVECALRGNARTIVTGDYHLLSLGGCQGVEMVRAADFLLRFAQ